MREATRYFVEMAQSGIAIEYVDVGGGLGVDYEGTRSRRLLLDQLRAGSIRLDDRAVARRSVRASTSLPQPHVITEAGRAMTAHHAVLVVNVSEVERAPVGRMPPARRPTSPPCCATCATIHGELDPRSVDRAVSRSAAPLDRRPGAVRARPARRCAIARGSTICTTRSLNARARAPEARRALAPPGARRAEREARRQVLHQFLGVRIDSRRVGDRPGVPDRADRRTRHERRIGAA